MSEDDTPSSRGYGNLYTPHAGSMIVHVQRENGLASRTLVFSPGQVKLLRLVFSRIGAVLALAFTLSWIFFAIQSARVPMLTKRLAGLHDEAIRLDTLQRRLDELQRRYAQVQGLMSVGGQTSSAPSAPTHWPLPIPGFITRGRTENADSAHTGLDIAVPVGTQVRSAGAGVVAEVGESSEYGQFIRILHSEDFESLYGHLGKVFVATGAKINAEHVIGLSGNSGRSTAPHLHFEIRKGGVIVDPLQIIKKRSENGDLH
jgi:murein DD-endopeptidase MepM/ murein hydrolase activator NlpD